MKRATTLFDALFAGVQLNCTVCHKPSTVPSATRPASCGCWLQCSCGWSYLAPNAPTKDPDRGRCRNPIHREGK